MPKHPKYPIYIEMGLVVRALRQSKDILLVDLCIATGLNRSSIKNFEDGRHNIRLSHLVHLAEALGIRLSELIAMAEQQMESKGIKHHVQGEVWSGDWNLQIGEPVNWEGQIANVFQVETGKRGKVRIKLDGAKRSMLVRKRDLLPVEFQANDTGKLGV